MNIWRICIETSGGRQSNTWTIYFSPSLLSKCEQTHEPVTPRPLLCICSSVRTQCTHTHTRTVIQSSVNQHLEAKPSHSCQRLGAGVGLVGWWAAVQALTHSCTVDTTEILRIFSLFTSSQAVGNWWLGHTQMSHFPCSLTVSMAMRTAVVFSFGFKCLSFVLAFSQFLFLLTSDFLNNWYQFTDSLTILMVCYNNWVSWFGHQGFHGFETWKISLIFNHLDQKQDCWLSQYFFSPSLSN